jgi:hypothetical protein
VLTVENDKSEKVTIENPILSNIDDEFPTIDVYCLLFFSFLSFSLSLLIVFLFFHFFFLPLMDFFVPVLFSELIL